MTEQEFHEIYDTLIELTKQGTIPWKRIKQAEYQVEFSRSSVVVQLESDQFGGVHYDMNVYNEDGKLIASSSPWVDELSGVRQFDLDSSALYELIESQIYKYSETTKN